MTLEWSRDHWIRIEADCDQSLTATSYPSRPPPDNRCRANRWPRPFSVWLPCRSMTSNDRHSSTSSRRRFTASEREITQGWHLVRTNGVSPCRRWGSREGRENGSDSQLPPPLRSFRNWGARPSRMTSRSDRSIQLKQPCWQGLSLASCTTAPHSPSAGLCLN